MFTLLIPRACRRLIHQRCFSTVRHEQDVTENSTRRILADSSTPLPLIIPTSGVPIHLYTRTRISSIDTINRPSSKWHCQRICRGYGRCSRRQEQSIHIFIRFRMF